jgi:hypothetical protein
VIVDQVEIERVAVLEPDDQPPVAGDREAPVPRQIALQDVDAPARQRGGGQLREQTLDGSLPSCAAASKPRPPARPGRPAAKDVATPCGGWS